MVWGRAVLWGRTLFHVPIRPCRTWPCCQQRGQPREDGGDGTGYPARWSKAARKALISI